MAIYITARRMAGGEGHEHIARVRWRNDQTSATGESTRADMVDYIDNKSGDVRVADGSSWVKVITVAATPKYIRTVSDGKYTNNLLSLPEF